MQPDDRQKAHRAEMEKLLRESQAMLKAREADRLRIKDLLDIAERHLPPSRD